MDTGKPTALQIRNFREPRRYGDGDGLALVLTAPDKGYGMLRSTIKGRRRDIGLESLSLVTLKDAGENAFDMRRDIQRGIDPIAECKKQEVVVSTFADAARTVHREQKASWKNGKHQNQWIRTLGKPAF